MKIKEIIQRVLDLNREDTYIPNRRVYNKLLSSRSKLISHQARKKQKISHWNYQTLHCVELVEAPANECPCIPQIGCKTYKTKYPLPSPLIDLNKHLIQYVSSIDGHTLYSEVSFAQKRYKTYNKYTAFKPDYYLRDSHLYLTHKTNDTLVSISGLFQDPLEAYDFPSYCPNVECGDLAHLVECKECKSYLELDFPIDGTLIDTIVEMSSMELYPNQRPQQSYYPQRQQQQQQQQEEQE